jgi:hypothetical protein
MEFLEKKIYVTSTQEISVACRKPVTTPTDYRSEKQGKTPLSLTYPRLCRVVVVVNIEQHSLIKDEWVAPIRMGRT